MFGDDLDRNDFYLFALQMTGYSFTFWPAQITIGRRGQKLQTAQQLLYATSEQKPNHHLSAQHPTHTSTSSLWTHFFCNSEVWPQELSIALRQVILGCFQNNWPRAWWEKALFLSAQKWQPEIYLKVVLLTWNFGSRPKIDFYDHIIF